MELDMYTVREAALRLIVVVLSLTLHEWGHAIVADKLGDNTPRSEGRVTLYPMAHLDWIGTVLFPLLGALGFFGNFAALGWAKPVYTNPANFRRGYFDQALVTIAGPAVNLALAFLGVFLTVVFARLHMAVAADFFWMATGVNVGLFVFNLLPIPPLDGSKFLMYWGAMTEDLYMRLSMFGGFFLLLLINIPVFRKALGMLIAGAMKPFELILIALT